MISRTRGTAKAVLTAICLFASVPAAFALEEKATEKEDLKACEQRMCQIILKKETAGDDLKCDISKTWTKSKIEDGVKQKKISWGFGDARCGIALGVPRATMVDALTKPEHALEFPKHTIKCEIEREKEVTNVNITLAPKVTFKDGKAQKAWLNVSEIDAPSVVKAGIWTAAKLEDNFGLFHTDMIEEINEFVSKKCAQRYPQ